MYRNWHYGFTFFAWGYVANLTRWTQGVISPIKKMLSVSCSSKGFWVACKLCSSTKSLKILRNHPLCTDIWVAMKLHQITKLRWLTWMLLESSIKLILTSAVTRTSTSFRIIINDCSRWPVIAVPTTIFSLYFFSRIAIVSRTILMYLYQVYYFHKHWITSSGCLKLFPLPQSEIMSLLFVFDGYQHE